MPAPADDGGTARRVAISLLLLAVAAGGATDLVLDLPHAPGLFHVAFELALLGLSLGGIAALWLGWARARRRLVHARASSERLRGERDAWRARTEVLRQGLGEAIDAQFRAWSLTPAERETALLLLKGCGHKEIATLCNRSERTVRQHAVAVYRKSGVAGRAELAAFFLEDLLVPSADTGASSAPREVCCAP
jgi:DNA-binding CsgD family transcriptional regulator